MQAAAPVDILALAPAPPSPPKGAGRVPTSLFHGDLLAYASSSAVVVLDTQKLSTAITLCGAHRNAAVTALAWHPADGPREPRAFSYLRLASGDEDGRVMVWSVHTGSVIAALDDPMASAFGSGARRPEGARPAVAGLAWATAAHSVLAILLAPAVLVLWDYKTGSVLWRKDFGGREAFTGIEVDPLDRRRLVLCGSKGGFIVLRLINPGSDRVKQQQYQVELGAGGTLRAVFSRTHDLLFLLLQREIIVFDLEFGQPAASTALPASRPPLDDVLGCFGHAAAGKALGAGGIDTLYCSHKDGSLSVWQRSARLLTYSLVGSMRLLPPTPKMHTGTAPVLVALAAGLWRGLQPQGDADSGGPLAALQLRDGSRPHPGTVRRAVSRPEDGGGDSSTHNSAGAAVGEAPYSVLVMGMASDGKVWQWQLPLLAGARPERKAPLPSMPQLQLLGLQHTLTQRVTAFSVCPTPVALPGSAHVVVTVAAATAAGTIELLPVQQGNLMPMHASISVVLVAHKSAVLGMRWLGAGPRLVSLSTEKVANGYRNTLLVTDVATRVSLPFRDVPVDAAPAAGLRASPSGAYLLLIFRGVPSEIWAMGGGRPRRLRQVDLQFTVVEWLGLNSLPLEQRQAAAAAAGEGEGGPARWAPQQQQQQRGGGANRAHVGEGQQAGGAGGDELEDRLVFALVDGRVGVLAVRGRRIQDTRPRRPSWAPLASGDFRVTTLSSWTQFVFLGDAEGNLARWDTVTGRCLVVETGHGRVLRIAAAPPPCELLHHNASAVQARVAVLFASGAFAVYDMDQASELRASHVTPTAAAARVGRATDLEWVPMPVPVGGGSVLAASLEDGSLALLDTVHNLDVRPRRMRMLRYRAALHAAPAPAAGGRPAARLAPPPPVASPLLLPRAWALFLRVLLQRGLADSVFRDLAALAGSSVAAGGGSAAFGHSLDAERALERLEGEVWACLPRGSLEAWEALARASEAQEAGSLAQILDEFADTEDEDPASGAMLVQAAAAGGPASPGSPGPSSRDAAAAAALGLAGRAAVAPGGNKRLKAEMAQTFKSLGGAFKGMAKDVAHASKAQLGRVPLSKLGVRSGSSSTLRQLGMLPPQSGVSDGAEAPPQARVGQHSLVTVLQAAGEVRGLAGVLSRGELASYVAALSSHRVADRMAVAAALSGDAGEAAFWRRLPATLAALKRVRPPSSAGSSRAGSASGEPPGAGEAGWVPPSAVAEAARMQWSELLERMEAGERSAWHEQMSRRVFENSEELQEKRVLEYVALGDFQTAVGFLLASPPDRSTRYYRDALCTLGMAFACGLQASASAAGAAEAAAQESAARTLFVQAAKVITANAASVGDSLLGVPLLCSTGQHADAANLLQDAGLWYYASALAALTLQGHERANALERWATHMAWAEGRPWTAAGVLVAAGALRSALGLLRQAGLPDAAMALVRACREAELPLEPGSLEAGTLQNLYAGGQAPVAKYNAAGERLGEGGGQGVGGGSEQGLHRATSDMAEGNETAREFQLYVAELLSQL